MTRPPPQLDGAQVLYYGMLDQRVKPTGRHRAIIDGHSYTPVYVAVCQYPDDSTIYRFYCDSSWNVMTDTDFETVEESIADIERDYAGAMNIIQKY